MTESLTDADLDELSDMASGDPRSDRDWIPAVSQLIADLRAARKERDDANEHLDLVVTYRRRLDAVLALTDHVAEGDGWGKCDNTWVAPEDVRAAATGDA